MQLRFIILMGLVSLFADFTYEGARSISGAYLENIGATALVLGTIFGVGELLNYSSRFIFGEIVERTRSYWLFIFVGYSLLFVIPLIALTDSLYIVATLLILERLGKAVRTPARDALVSFVAKKGYGFGLHEAIDQVGAIVGPITVSILLLWFKYRDCFLFLAIPAIFSIIFLIKAKKYAIYSITEGEKRKVRKGFFYFALFSFFSSAGLVNFQLVAYHMESVYFQPYLIPLFYAAAMLFDALVAVFAGKVYDKHGIKVLISIPLLTPITSLFILNPLISVIAIGFVLGIQESAMRAAVSEFSHKRARYYGIFNSVLGLGTFMGSITFGYIYDNFPKYLFLYSTVMQIIAASIFIKKFLVFRRF